MNDKQVFSLINKYLIPTYKKVPIVITKGKGCYVWDINNKKYLDFFPGWGVSSIGHCHPDIVSAIKKQTNKIIHISNNYCNSLQAQLAKKIVECSFSGKAFFCNSGAEANEAAIKFTRIYGKKDKRYKIITMKGSFHGRTMATIAATGQRKYGKNFTPPLKGFVHVEFNNIKAVKNCLRDDIIAIMIEPIQGEGGINVVDKDYLKSLRRICTQKDILLILDEVQTGMGRTGKMFCFQHYNIKPDIMILAKSLGGGLPIGAMIVKKEIADVMGPGTHASTFGGSPIVSAAALAMFDVIARENMLKNVNIMGEYLYKRLLELKAKHSIISKIKGLGLMLGIELKKEGEKIVEYCYENGLLINCTQDKILRLMPVLNVNKFEIDKAIRILDKAIAKSF